MPSIHLIAKKQLNVHPVRGSDGEWESGYWPVTEERAKELVGAKLYLHEMQSGPSYFGGTVLSYRVSDEGDGRYIFRFKFDAACKGNVSPRGWSQEMKFEP